MEEVEDMTTLPSDAELEAGMLLDMVSVELPPVKKGRGKGGGKAVGGKKSKR